jgi:hypothetical protein
MAILDPETVFTQIQVALAQDDINRAIQILESLRGPDQADVFNDLDEARSDRSTVCPSSIPLHQPVSWRIWRTKKRLS